MKDQISTQNSNADTLKQFGIDEDYLLLLEDETFPDQSFPFDRFIDLNHPELDALIEKLIQDEAENNERRARDTETTSKFRSSIKIIILNLLKVHIARHALHTNQIAVAIALSAGSYTAKSRYSQQGISYRTIRDVYNFLLNNDYLQIVKRAYYIPEAKYGESTRIGPTEKLAASFNRIFPDKIVFFSQDPKKETIELREQRRGSKVVRIEYEDDQFTHNARHNLTLINSLLQNHWYDLNLTNEQFQALHDEQVKRNESNSFKPFFIDFTHRALYRAFNNGKFNQGGRFYGAWWQSCPSECRRHITIDGKRTVEVDFSNVQPALLYAKEGLQLDKDAYSIPQLNGKVERKVIKKAFLRLLNGKGNPKVYPPDGYNAEQSGVSWPDLIESIMTEHHAVSKYFSSGIGVSLMFDESQIAEQVMLHFLQEEYPCLPIHDSFIVHYALGDELNSVMKQKYRDHTGMDISLDTDAGIDNLVSSVDPNDIEGVLGFISTNQYERRLQGWFDHKQSFKEQ